MKHEWKIGDRFRFECEGVVTDVGSMVRVELCHAEGKPFDLPNAFSAKDFDAAATYIEPPFVWRLLNAGETVQDGDQYWGHDGAWHPVTTWYTPIDNHPVRRKLEGGAK